MNHQTLFSQCKDLSLLLVEDNTSLRNDMAELLGDIFKTVTVAYDGSNALTLYKEYYINHDKNFDLVITDIEMPVMNGVELSKAIYARNKHQQIIVLSAHTDSQYLLSLINLGIARFLTKPINNDEFIHTLHHVR